MKSCRRAQRDASHVRSLRTSDAIMAAVILLRFTWSARAHGSPSFHCDPREIVVDSAEHPSPRCRAYARMRATALDARRGSATYGHVAVRDVVRGSGLLVVAWWCSRAVVSVCR